jgi:hypothetical protein
MKRTGTGAGMQWVERVLWTASLASLLIAATPALSQDYGDSPYVPTPQVVVDKMLEMGRVGPQDYVVDLGSGDGRIVITAASEFGASGFGVDIDWRLVELANKLATKAGVADRAKFYERDLFETDLSRATVVTLYLLPEVVLMLRPRLLEMLQPGTRIVSHDYDFGEWAPDASVVIDVPDKPVGRDFKSRIMYWVVPATVSGKWSWQSAARGEPEAFVLTLDQMFQEVGGTLEVGGRSTKIEQGKLNGANISFTANVGQGSSARRYEFSGRIIDERIEGEARAVGRGGTRTFAWKAVRTEATEPAHAALKPPKSPYQF